ncbi:PAS domain S-box-containing protein/diguanylate cyclase (GGDEF) domain-containing protein [Collimonas sp. OK607]|uniref:bifunctional diguanylate cyclase/phosphodiesterase n=1 Tax=Collimonas sp. OK607 TaxID=1798194 RepID=UPI0008EDA4B1|nr:EAL domain-containing protein [Collimonas sp. OK607]SFB09796.1 PAS domain S-box-containing protein/diguanylate cyclase (GGDEF) domain-containing protein [Collimonas sp. OK607]
MFRRGSSIFIPIASLSSLILGLAITLGLFVSVRHLEYEKMDAEFRRLASGHLKAVVDGLDGLVHELETVNRLFVTVDGVTREQFHTFTAPMLVRAPYIKSLGFQRLVSAAQRPAYEAEIRKRYPDFSIRQLSDGKPAQAAGHDEYRVVEFLEPMAGNEGAFAMDVATSKVQSEAAKRARDTGLPASTDLFEQKPKNGSKLIMMVLMPVYQHGAVLDSVDDRRRALVGFTSAALRADAFVNNILARDGVQAREDFNLRVYASAKPEDDTLVYRQGNQAKPSNASDWLPAWLLYDAPQDMSQTFELAGKPWFIEASAPARVFTKKNVGSLLVLILGSVLSWMGAAYLYFLSTRSKRIERLVDARTQQVKLATQMMKEDIVARKRAEDALQLRERAIESSANAIIISSAKLPDYQVEYVNPAFERITGYSARDMIGRNLEMLHGDDHDQIGLEEIRAALREKRTANTVFRSYRKDGTLFWNELYVAPVKDSSGRVSHFVTSLYDITEMKSYEAELEHQARHDTLTGLANRNVLSDRLSQSIVYGELYGHRVWVLFVDLDRFKFVNDTLGHNAGDQLLKEVASRLKAFTREADTIARLGSDEFVLILPERLDEELSVGLIQRMMDAIARPLQIEGYDFFLSCSIGVAVYPNDGTDPDSLLKHADIAMYRAKEMGNNNYQFYTAAMNERALERLQIEGDLRNALERKELLLYYQPQVDLRTGRMVGMEALIRWKHPQLGMISPTRFIDLAEETGLIVQMGAWVMHTACEQNKAWQRMGLGYLRMSVNLSTRQFFQQNLVQQVAEMLEATGLAPHYLEIELTESLVMTDVELAVGILNDLKSIGVQLSIDDFGTGYSSLAYLKSFPIDALKIDQSFVRDITVDQDDAAIVASIISLAHNLRLQVIAEGVETQEQLSYLQRHRCDEMQGFYFSEPVSAADIEIILREGKVLP